MTPLPTRRGSLQVAGAAVPVPVRIAHDLAVRRSDLPAEALADLRRVLTRPNPEYAERERAGRKPFDLVKDAAGKVIGRTPIPRDLCFLEESGGYVRAPRGAVGLLRATLIRNGRRIDPRPEVVWTGLAPLPADAPLGDAPRPYQIEAEDRMLGLWPGCAGVSGGIVLPCGCLGGDAELVVNRAGKGARMRIDHVVSMFNGGKPAGGRRWDPTIPTFVQAVDASGTRVLDRVVAAVCTGRKLVYRVLVEGRQPLRATADHRFLTPGGWLRLHELRPGDHVLVVEQSQKAATPGVPRRGRGDSYYPRLGGMHAHPYATRWWPSRSGDGEQAQVPTHRLVAEAALNGLGFESFVQRLRGGTIGGLTFLDPREFTVHHRDRNRRNFAVDNLEVLRVEDHLRLHADDGTWRNVLPTAEPARISEIEALGEEPTYDLTMAAPGANYVANGIVVHNSGKTYIGARALVRSGQAGVVFVHTVDLFDQWVGAIWRAHGVAPREVRAEKALRPLRPGELAVAMIQTVRKAGSAADTFLRSAGAVLCDEAHHLPADTFHEVISRCPARYRWWLSATPEREDGLGFILPWVMGPILLRRTSGELARDGYLVLPRVLPVKTGWAPDMHAHYTAPGMGREPHLDWSATSYGVAGDATRNALIVRLAQAAVAGGRTTIVLVTMIEHAEALASQLASCGIAAAPITGDVAKGARRERIAQLRSGALQVGIATSLADEGLDVPRLGCLILAAPQKTWGRSQQRIGRLTRPHGGKGAGIAIDLVDGGPLAAQYRRRARAYEEALGYPPEGWTSIEAAVEILGGPSAPAGLF